MPDFRAKVPPLNEWHEKTEKYRVIMFENHFGASKGVSQIITRQQRAKYEAEQKADAEFLREHAESLRLVFGSSGNSARLRRIADRLER